MEDQQKKPTQILRTPELTEQLRTVQNLDDLRLATIRGNLEEVKKSLNKGIAINQTLKGGWSPLLYACSMGHCDIVEYLLQEGANPNFHKELFTPLMAVCASTRENEEKLVRCIDLLIKYNAEINAAERHRITALMFAAKEGHQKLVAKLCSHGCDFNIQDSQGWTALFWAVNQGKTKVVEILVKAGAKLDIKDRRNQTVIDIANSKGLDEIIAVLNNKQFTKEQPLLENGQLNGSATIVKTGDSLFNSLLDELTQYDNNNEVCGKNISRVLSSMEFENNLDALKEHGKKISRIANHVNGYIKNGYNKFNNFSKIVYSNGNLKTPIELHSNGIAKYPIELRTRNIPYSVIEAKQVLSHTIKHLAALYASTSYVRLRLQGNPVNMLLEDKHSRITDLSVLADKAMYQTTLLYNELKFLQQHSRKLEESDQIVPADTVTEHRRSKYGSKVLTVAVVSAVVIVALYNDKITFSHLQKFFNFR